MSIAQQKITPCLWFDTDAEAAANHYVSIFKELQDRQDWPLWKGGKANRVMKAMLQMKKLDIAALQKAAA
jgi:predicted 3-demethylubiquinone-9 3-methyltransferase (glyoxalase superfamily)